MLMACVLCGERGLELRMFSRGIRVSVSEISGDLGTWSVSRKLMYSPAQSMYMFLREMLKSN
ncbi:hypothetical protein BDY19DRAFT_594446 [Irpex rosettiformis]|uniref:Uncharacterized protein n=1 Tax=Irpex rosettiformis TaxID=378272 RepID=A0ACB8UDJ2_9APHY|nr:hypothetical protein BDY19DRAFT_594446 [Irpex rosettiformis]